MSKSFKEKSIKQLKDIKTSTDKQTMHLDRKRSFLPRLNHGSKKRPIKISRRIFVGFVQLILKYTWKNNGLRISRTLLKDSQRNGRQPSAPSCTKIMLPYTFEIRCAHVTSSANDIRGELTRVPSGRKQ